MLYQQAGLCAHLSSHIRRAPPAIFLTAVMTPRRFHVAAWLTYDWANSAYSTISITFLALYITRVVLPGDEGTLAYGWSIGLSCLVAALLSPVLGAVADARASKRLWLAVTALGGSAAAVALAFVPTTQPWLVVALFSAMTLGFELSQGFYNAFLPELTDDRTVNRVSAFGFALGYIGGGLALIVGMLIFQFGNDPPGQTEFQRVCLVLGLWWGGFTLPTVWILRDRTQVRNDAGTHKVIVQAVSAVWQTLKNIRSLPTLFLFLVGFLIYNDGVQTVISQASVFADKALKVEPRQLLLVVLMIQFVAPLGSIVIGWMSDRLGQKAALMICLAVWTCLLAAAFFVRTLAHFWIMGVVLALVLGGIQSVSRAIMGVLTPAGQEGEFFGFFNLSSKATSFAGPILFSSILAWSSSPHWAIVSLLVFIIGGAIVVSRVDVEKGKRERAV